MNRLYKNNIFTHEKNKKNFLIKNTLLQLKNINFVDWNLFKSLLFVLKIIFC